MVGSPGDKYIWEDSSPTRETDNTFYFDGRINYRRVFGNHTVSLSLIHIYASRPFYVETSQMTVDVLGTKFNVSAYKDDEVQSVVLAEGKVNIQATEKENCVLSPDQRFQLSTSDRHFSVDEVDATDYIAWKEGILKFRGDTMEEITHRLSRYYNVRISCDPEDVYKRQEQASPIKLTGNKSL